MEPQEDIFLEKKITWNNFKKRVRISNWRNSDRDKENDSCKTCKTFTSIIRLMHSIIQNLEVKIYVV